MKLPFDTYLSPYTWRYGSNEMRKVWSEINRRKNMRKVWVELAKAQNKAGLIKKDELKDIIAHENDVDIERSREIEKEIYHEVMAEIKCFAEQCKIGGGKIHLGATSADILDNAEILQIKEGVEIIKKKLKELIKIFAEKIEEYQNLVCMGFTHLQPAEPTTLGYRLSLYTQDLLWDLEFLEKAETFIKGKGIKGAVGTGASYEKLLKGNKTSALELEKEITAGLGVEPVDVSGQTYPRKTDLIIIEALVNIASSIHKFNFDLRIMQSPAFGEWSEPRSSKRVGSSAMPFKKNPDKAEKVCSICRLVSSYLNTAWSNPSMSLLERTLDESANRRTFIPESFLIIDEAIITTALMVKDLVIFEKIIKANLEKFGIFSSTESLMMEAVKKGANRQDMHELIRDLSMKAWDEVSQGKPNPLKKLLLENKEIKKYLKAKGMEKLLDPGDHIGNAKQRTEFFLKKIKKCLLRKNK